MNQQPGSFPPVQPTRPTTPPPTPPPPEITLRTMQSDIASLKQTGGSGAAPKPFTPPELTKELARPAVPPPPMPKIPQSDFSMPRPPAPAMPSSAAPKIEIEASGGSWKKMLVWGGALLLIIGAGAAGYLYVYPMLFPQLPSAPPAPAITTPSNEAVIPEPEAAAPTTEAPTQPRMHKSALSSVAATSQVMITTLDLAALKSALKSEALKSAAPESLVEIVLSDAGGQLAVSSVLPAMLPSLTAETVKRLFADDFTTALYHDANGVWPVYILTVSPSSSQVEAQPVVASLETSADLANLFVSAPGTQSAAGFKAGKVNELNTRYLTFSKTGASLNVAWLGNNLVVSTSYNGLKKVLGSLAK